MKKVRARLAENFNIAFIALALAVVTWAFAKSGESVEARLVVPVLPDSTAANDSRLEVIIEPSTVPVVVRYPRDAVSDVNSGNFSLIVDTADLREELGVEWKRKTVDLSDNNWETNLQGSRVKPIKFGQQNSTVEVRMRWRATPALVVPQIVGEDKLPDGLQLVTPVKVIPREVYLIGDQKIMADMMTDPVTSRILVQTEPVNVANKKLYSLEEVDLKLPAGVTLIRQGRAIAEVIIEIQEVQTVREIRGIPIAFQAVSPETVSLEHSVQSANLTVFGPQSLLTQLSTESFRFSLIRPAEEIPGTDRELPLDAHFAPSVSDEVRSKVTIRSIDPKTIRVKYSARNPVGAR